IPAPAIASRSAVIPCVATFPPMKWNQVSGRKTLGGSRKAAASSLPNARSRVLASGTADGGAPLAKPTAPKVIHRKLKQHVHLSFILMQGSGGGIRKPSNIELQTGTLHRTTPARA